MGASAFFLQSDLSYSNWVHNTRETVQDLQSHFTSAMQNDSTIFLLSLSSDRTSARYSDSSSTNPRKIILHTGAPEFFVGWSGPYAHALWQGTVTGEDATHLGATLSSQITHSHWTWLLQGSQATFQNSYWNWQEPLFAAEVGDLGGDWSTKASQLHTNLAWHSDAASITGALDVVSTSPAPMFNHWGLRDSSLWVQGEASFAIFWHNWQFKLSATSLSGNLQLEGIRDDLGDEKCFMQLESGWDVNSLWLDIAPYTQPKKSSTPMPQPVAITPWQQLLHQMQQPPSTQTQLGLGYSWAHIQLFLPNVDEGEQTFWGNRLENPDLIDLLGYSIYKKDVSLSGSGLIHAYHLRASAPWWGEHWGLWASAAATHWQASMQEQGSASTQSILSETHRARWGTVTLDGILAQISTGIRIRSAKKSPWILSLEARQLIPYIYQFEAHNQDDSPAGSNALPSSTHSSSTASTSFFDWRYTGEGLSLRMGLEHDGW